VLGVKQKALSRSELKTVLQSSNPPLRVTWDITIKPIQTPNTMLNGLPLFLLIVKWLSSA
jgi:hypothetical protein